MKINRSRYIGGSDAAAILGLDRYRSRHDVYLDKIGEGTEREQNEAMYFGKILESTIRREYIKRTGRRVRVGAIRHPAYPFIGGHVDGKGDALLEIKVARDGADWGDDGASDIEAIPAYYRPQLVHYMNAAGVERADVAALIRGQELRIYPDIPRPEWADDLLVEEVEFWNGNVVPRIPPELDGSEGASRMLRRRFPLDSGEELIALPEQYPVLDALRLARQNVLQAEQAERQASQLIQTAMGEASTLLGPDVKITWKKVRDAEITDWRLYAESIEKLVPPGNDLDTLKSLYTNRRQGARRFVVKFTDPAIEGDRT